jgi:uncharacterized protein YprB with RNaseH-like and TPR domain
MLKNTFLHLPGITENKEKKIWESGITCWDNLINSDSRILRNFDAKEQIENSNNNYKLKNHEYFSKLILPKYHWRAYDDFKENACFLDIETTGLDKHHNEITVIGLYDGKESKVFINGINLQDFSGEIKKYSYIVTFNGSMFDIPFIKAKFPDLNINQFHADLRFMMKNLGYSGGLKKIEKELGIERDSDLAGMNGFDAVILWHKYKRFDDKAALDKLVRYNIEDIENLKYMMEFSYGKLREKCLANL